MSKDKEYKDALEKELEKCFPWDKEHISMRDYFAAHALATMQNDSSNFPELAAKDAYKIADAMIEARKK